MIKQGNNNVDTIWLHCAATSPGWYAHRTLQDKIHEIRRWHLARGFKDIGYHWLIDRDGKVGKGRDMTVQGAHTKGHNRGSIGICLIGGKGSKSRDPFLKNFTEQQELSLYLVMRAIHLRTKIVALRGHNEVAAKACPGFNVTNERAIWRWM